MSNEPTAGIRVLLVEDNEIDVEITKRVLAKSGLPIRLDVARDGEDALAALLDAKQGPLPRLILVDLRLPGMDGAEVVRRIRRDPELGPIPVAVLTGATGDRAMLESIEAGANMYFVKPITAKDAAGIVDAVERYWQTIERLIRKQSKERRAA